MTHVQLKKTDTLQDLFIYGVIGDVFDGVTAKQVNDELAKADTSKRLRVRINSVGGLVNEGMAIYTSLNLWEGDVDTHVDSIAASAATLPFLAGENRVMAEGTKLQIHEPWLMVVGSKMDLRKALDELEVYERDIVDIYEKHTTTNAKQLTEWIEADTTLDTQASIDAGFATEATGDAAIAACVDKDILPLFLTEQRVAAWAPLLDSPGNVQNQDRYAAAREHIRIKKALTARKTEFLIMG